MKQCSYCGAEYTDDAAECAIDKTPLAEVEPKSSGFDRPSFAVFSEYKIPVSLTIVSYLFFLPGALGFGLAAFIFGLLIYSGSQVISSSSWALFGCASGVAFGIFWLCLSRGLRRCSRGWRTCALVFIWWGFIVMAYAVGQFFYLQDARTRICYKVYCGKRFGVYCWLMGVSSSHAA